MGHIVAWTEWRRRMQCKSLCSSIKFIGQAAPVNKVALSALSQTRPFYTWRPSLKLYSYSSSTLLVPHLKQNWWPVYIRLLRYVSSLQQPPPVTHSLLVLVSVSSFTPRSTPCTFDNVAFTEKRSPTASIAQPCSRSGELGNLSRAQGPQHSHRMQTWSHQREAYRKTAHVLLCHGYRYSTYHIK